MTFPGPEQQSENLGVELYRVEGTYRPRTSRDNPVEARKVVERVFTHAERGQRSIGVVAFSEAQASLIEEALRRNPRRHDPRFESLFSDDRLGALFVKNLENVQGDERNVIIFSVGYGPDENGKFSMNFGPVNREGGWRRLNVAITRARQRVEIINSFAPERISKMKSRGPQELRHYLEYAQRGPSVLAIDPISDSGEPESPFEEAVMRTLRAWGHDVVAQVGTAGYRIDLAIRHPEDPGRYLLGIECDGAMYHSSRAARDRDRLRERSSETSTGSFTGSGARAGITTGPVRNAACATRSTGRYRPLTHLKTRPRPHQRPSSSSTRTSASTRLRSGSSRTEQRPCPPLAPPIRATGEQSSCAATCNRPSPKKVPSSRTSSSAAFSNRGTSTSPSGAAVRSAAS